MGDDINTKLYKGTYTKLIMATINKAVTIYVTPEQKSWINSRPHNAVSISQLIREFLDRYMVDANDDHNHK